MKRSMIPDRIGFNVASTDLDNDVKAIRKLMDDLGRMVHAGNPKNNFMLGSDAVYAMGWYFYELSVSRELLKKLVNIHGKEILGTRGRGFEQKSSNWLMAKLKQHNCGAQIKPKSQKEFRGLWPWLLK